MQDVEYCMPLPSKCCFAPRTNEFNFGDDLDHRPDPGVRNPHSLDYRKLLTDFDEILWRAGVWPRDQLVTCW